MPVFYNQFIALKPYCGQNRRIRRCAWLLAGLFLSGCATDSSPDNADKAEIAGINDSYDGTALRMAERAASEGQLELAANFYTQAHQQEPTKTAILIALGKVHLKMQAAREAARAFRAALSLNAKEAEAHWGLGQSFLQLRQNDSAANSFRAAVELQPTEPRYHNALGVALDKQGLHAAAQAAYQQGLKHAPNHTALKNNLGLSLLLAGDEKAALLILEPLGNAVSASVQHRQNLALAYGLAGREDDAAAMARQDLVEADVQKNLAFYAQARQERLLRGVGGGLASGHGQFGQFGHAADGKDGPDILAAPVKPVAFADMPVAFANMDEDLPPAVALVKEPAVTPTARQSNIEKSKQTEAVPEEKKRTTDAPSLDTAANEAPLAEPKAGGATLAAEEKPEAYVQAGVYTSQAAALQGWQKHLADDHPQLSAGSFQLSLPNGGNYWRLKITGFSEPQAAQDFCEKLIKVPMSCLVIGF